MFFLGSLAYVALPIMYAKSIGLFAAVMFFSIILTIQKSNNLDTWLFKLYIWSFAFFGVSIGGLKLSDVVLIVSCMLLIIRKGKLVVNSKMLLIIPFFLYLFLQMGYFYLARDSYLSNMLLELSRYALALLTGLFFYQLQVNRGSLIKWLDKFCGLVSLQALVMYLVQTKATIANIDSGRLLAVSVFSDTTESRISAFFSDPNKMMAFFLLVLVIRILIEFKDKRAFNWHWQYWLYLLGALISLSRTSVIVVAMFLLFYAFYEKIFKKENLLGTSVMLLLLVVFAAVGLLFKTTFVSTINDVFDGVLALFGRDRTLTIDSNVTSDSRVLVWRSALSYIEQRPIFGNGLASELHLLPIPTHNSVVQLLLDTGIVGLVLYTIGLFNGVIKRIPGWVVVSLVVIPMFFLDLANFRLIFVMWSLAMKTDRFEKGGI